MINSERHIDVKIIGLQRGTEVKSIRLLLLRALNSERCMPLLLTKDEHQQMQKLLADLYAERLDASAYEFPNRLMKAFGITLEYLLLLGIPYGEHQTFAVYQQGEHLRRMKVSLPEATIFSYLYDKPIKVHTEYFEHATQCINNNGSVSFSLSDLTEEILIEQEQLAVESDNYEMAMRFRNERRRRHINNNAE